MVAINYYQERDYKGLNFHGNNPTEFKTSTALR